MILGLDAGFSAKNATGVALVGGGTRQLCAATVIRRDPNLEGLEAMQDVANKVLDWVDAQDLPEVTAFVTEMPFVYPRERKNPNTSLVPLAGVLACVSGGLPRNANRVAHYPRDWKGTLDGDVFAGRTYGLLSASERGIVDAIMPAGLRHNALDAVGLCFHFLGRLVPARVIHNEPKQVG